MQKSLEAVQLLEIQNDSVEVIDLRTLNPLDMDLIETSIMKTSKALVVHEDNITLSLIHI